MQNTDNLRRLHSNLAKKDGFNVPFEQFATDMQDETKFKRLYDNLTNKDGFNVPYDQFKVDMFGESMGGKVDPIVEPAGQEIADTDSLKQNFRQNPRSVMGMPLDTAQQISADVAHDQLKESADFTGFGKEIGLRATRGANELNRMLVNAPDAILRTVNAIPNEIFKAVGLPEIQSFNDVVGISENKEYFDKQNEILSKKIESVNAKHDKSIVEAAKEGDWVTFTRNLAGGVADSFAPSLAMMISGATMAPGAMIGTGAAVFGAGKLDEIDKVAPDLPEPLKVLAAASNGALEGIFETYLGSGAVGKAFLNLASRQGKEVATRTLTDGLRKGFSDVLTKYPALAPFGEGFEEWGTQIAQNYVDKITGVNPDINVFDGSLDALLIGVASGASHMAPLYGAKIISKQFDKNQPVPSTDSPEIPQINPEDTFKAQIQGIIDTRTHESGNLVFANHEKHGPVMVKQGQVDEFGRFKTEDGLVMYYDQEGNILSDHESLFSGDVQVIPPDEFFNAQLQSFKAEQQRQQIASESSFEIDGRRFVETGQADEKGNPVIVPLDDNSNPI
ncbi:MAG TPA: hypothetical protein DCY25_13005, partial [Bacteroidales bacterium]|nr:hypothetical protein [Bacteroidales bacterium]